MNQTELKADLKRAEEEKWDIFIDSKDLAILRENIEEGVKSIIKAEREKEDEEKKKTFHYQWNALAIACQTCRVVFLKEFECLFKSTLSFIYRGNGKR